MTETRSEGTAEASQQGTLRLLGMWLGRHSTAYLIANVVVLVLSMGQVAVVTRFLDPSEYGKAGLLFVLASSLTVFYSLPVYIGTLQRAFGLADEDGDDGEDAEAEGQIAPIDETQKRRALGTGLSLTLAMGALGTLIAVLLAPELAELLVNDRSDVDLVILAAVSGGVGALARILLNISRFELRPGRFLLLSAIRPVLVVGAVTPLVASGHGVVGLVGGTALGSTAAAAVAAVVTWRSWDATISRGDIGPIFKQSISFAPIHVSYWVIQSGDLFALSRYAPHADVGLYRFAGRFGAVGSYGAGSFLMAWVPLRRTETYQATTEKHGTRVGATLLTYYCLFALALLVVLTIGADTLVRIASPSYAAAAPLIPLTATAFASHGLLVTVNRASTMPRKRIRYRLTAVGSMLAFVAMVPFLIPALGAYGAALSAILSFVLGAGAMFAMSQWGRTPLEMPYRRLFAALAVALICAGSSLMAPVVGVAELPVKLGALLAFFPLLIVSGAIPMEQARALLQVARVALSPRAAGLDRTGLVRAKRRKRSEIDPIAAETRIGDELGYFFHQPEITYRDRRDVLLVSFSAALGKLPGYANPRPFRNLGCGVLFIRASGGLADGATQRRIGELIHEHARNRGIPRERVICCGIGKGGSLALVQAARAGFGAAVVGSPLMRIGDTLLGQGVGKRRRRTAEALVGTSDDRAREQLNWLVFDQLRQADSDTVIHLLSSKNEPHDEATRALMASACVANRRLTLNEFIDDYSDPRHGRRVFVAFLGKRLSKVIKSLPNPSPSPTAS